MQEIRFQLVPVKSNKVIWADEVVIQIFDSYLSIKVDVLEEVPDDLMGSKERKRDGIGYIAKHSIIGLEWAYDNDNECYEFSIFTTNPTWSYNCKDKATAKGNVDRLVEWWLK